MGLILNNLVVKFIRIKVWILVAKKGGLIQTHPPCFLHIFKVRCFDEKKLPFSS